MSAPAILVVDDELSIRRAVATLLRTRGYLTITAGTAREALDLFDRERPRAVILDLGLPDADGVDVCRELRARADVPILILSVHGDEQRKVAALDAGADDYVTKPFGSEELLARLRAAVRRAPEAEQTRHGCLSRGDLVIDFDRRRIHRADEEIRLTPREFDLLALLAANAGRVLTHKAIAKAIWAAAGAPQQEHLRVLVGQLRKKVERDPANPRYVITEPWVGYRFGIDG